MTSTQFATYVRLKTSTNSDTFTDANILLLMELRQYEIAGDILKADERILLIPQLDDLVADQREYSQPADILSRMTRVEAKLDETNFIKLNEKPITNIEHALTETVITNNYSNIEGEVYFYIARKAINILSGTITGVTDGLKIWVDTYPSVIVALNGSTDLSVDPSTTTHGVPKAMHEIWARGVIIDYKESREKLIPLSESELSYDKDKQEAVNVLKQAYMDRDTIGVLPSAANRWNDGFDL